ncbi:MAG: O-antigen ligase family protein [Acidimicrobiales bacterium]
MYGWGLAIGAFLLPVLFLPTLSSSVEPPKTAVLWVLTGAGLPFLVLLALGQGRARGSSTRTWAARAAVGFVVVAGIATVLSKAPLHSVVGDYTDMTGLLFFGGLAACWALGTGVSAADRRLVENAIIWAAALNALVAFYQRFPGLKGVGLGMYGGNQPDGLLGNPVFFGALLAASLALLAPRMFERPGVWAPVTALVAFATALSGERLPVLVAVVVVAWSIWALHRSDGLGLRDALSRTRAIVYGATSAVALLVGSIIPGPGSFAHHLAASTATETFGARFGAWLVGLHALAAQPVFGAGPAQFEAATLPHYSVAFAQATAQRFFNDAHNMVVEVTVTTGVLGLVAFAAWVFFALRDRGGPLVVFALAIGITELAEPLFVGLTSLAFLALGAAALRSEHPWAWSRDGSAPTTGSGKRSKGPRAPGDPPVRPGALPRPVRIASVVLASVAAVAGLVLIVGDVAQQRAATSPEPTKAAAAIGDGTTANTLLPAWPTPAVTLATVYYTSGTQKHSGVAQAVHWSEIAVQRDPTQSRYWYYLAAYQFAAGNDAGARAAAHHALAVNPVFTQPLNLLADMAALDGNRAAEHGYLVRSLRYTPNQEVQRQYLSGRCKPLSIVAFGARSFSSICSGRPLQFPDH